MHTPDSWFVPCVFICFLDDGRHISNQQLSFAFWRCNAVKHSCPCLETGTSGDIFYQRVVILVVGNSLAILLPTDVGWLDCDTFFQPSERWVRVGDMCSLADLKERKASLMSNVQQMYTLY